MLRSPSGMARALGHKPGNAQPLRAGGVFDLGQPRQSIRPFGWICGSLSRMMLPAPWSVNSSSRQAFGARPSRMTTARTPPAIAASAVSVFGIMPPAITPWSVRSRTCVGESCVTTSPLASFTPAISVSSSSRSAFSAGGDGARDRVAVDVIGLARAAHAQRRDHRDEPAVNRWCSRSVFTARAAHKAQVWSSASQATMPPSLPDRPTARPPSS